MIFWTNEEITQLECLAEEIPYAMIVDAYNKWALKHGYPPRTIKAIEHVASRNGFSLRSTGKWITTAYIANALGVAHSTVRNWVCRGDLPKYSNCTKRYVQRKDLCELARRKPHLFSIFSRERLIFLFESEKLVEYICNSQAKRTNLKKPVRAIETGVIYESVNEAARQVHIVHRSLRTALRQGRTAAGYHWEFVQ